MRFQGGFGEWKHRIKLANLKEFTLGKGRGRAVMDLNNSTQLAVDWAENANICAFNWTVGDATDYYAESMISARFRQYIASIVLVMEASISLRERC